MTKSKIEWTEKVWNTIRGCALVSAGCKNCYAMKQAYRFDSPGQPYDGLTEMGPTGARWTGKARFVSDMVDRPLDWKLPCVVFVNSMSDLFHADVTNEQIAAVFGVMAACPQHTFQILTKRPERMLEWFKWIERFEHPNILGCLHVSLCDAMQVQGDWDPDVLHCEELLSAEWPLPNVHLGVSCENQEAADERIPILRSIPAALRWVSAEPLLAEVKLPLDGIDWVVVGGESGPGARQCCVEWIEKIVRDCKGALVPVFVKQLGAAYVDSANAIGGAQTKPVPEYGPITKLRHAKGGDMSEWPVSLRVREYPTRPEQT